MEEEKPRIYKDYEDYWRHGKHGCSSYSRDIVEDTWKDLEPTILANRTDWEQLLLAEGKGIYRQYISAIIDWRDYLEEFNLEKVAGIGFPTWRMDRLRKKWDKEDSERKEKNNESADK